jgi:hypothetical protein
MLQVVQIYMVTGVTASNMTNCKNAQHVCAWTQ